MISCKLQCQFVRYNIVISTYAISRIEVECITPLLHHVSIYLLEKKSAYLSKIFVNETHTRTFCVHLELITLMHNLARNFSNLHLLVCCDTWLHSSIPYRLYEFSIIINFTHDFPAGIPITQ